MISTRQPNLEEDLPLRSIELWNALGRRRSQREAVGTVSGASASDQAAGTEGDVREPAAAKADPLAGADDVKELLAQLAHRRDRSHAPASPY